MSSLIASSAWEDLGQCPECCGYYYPYYYYYAADNTVLVACCDTPVNKNLFASIDTCDGDATLPLDYQEGSNPPQWDSPAGTICSGIGETDRAIVFRCEEIDEVDTFAIYFNDVAQGPYFGTLVSCDPFIWISDPINLDGFGCACGDFVVTITE